MTRKDYVAIAEAIAEIRREVHPDQHRVLNNVDLMALRLAQVLQQDNERFDRDRFLLATQQRVPRRAAFGALREGAEL